MARTALVISAHAADFVWRCGGAIALHQKRGYEVTVVCLSFGERGESAKLWKEKGMTLDRVKTARKKEAEAAAKALDVHDIQFFDLGDYPLVMDQDAKFRLVDVIRAVQPAFMLSHSHYDSAAIPGTDRGRTPFGQGRWAGLRLEQSAPVLPASGRDAIRAIPGRARKEDRWRSLVLTSPISAMSRCTPTNSRKASTSSRASTD